MASFAIKGEQPVRKVSVGLRDINSSLSKFLRGCSPLLTVSRQQ